MLYSSEISPTRCNNCNCCILLDLFHHYLGDLITAVYASVVYVYISCTCLSRRPEYTGVLISPQPDQEGNKLQRPNSNFCKPLKNNSEGCPSNQVSAAAMTSASDEKWRNFNCFFQSNRAKDLSAPLYFPVCWTKGLGCEG